MASSRASMTHSSSAYPATPSTSDVQLPRRKKQKQDTSGGTSRARSRTANTRRPATAATSTTNALANQEIIVAVSESRGISPIVGLAILNLSSAEVVLCQICDTQTYVRAIHKISVFGPTEVLFSKTAQRGKLLGLVEENLTRNGGSGLSKGGSDSDLRITCIDRKYWNEADGLEYVQQLALPEDVEALKVSMAGNFYAASSFAAVMKYVELGLSQVFAYQTLRIKFEPSQGSAMIDLSTISSLELIQNMQNAKSKHCLLGFLNETLTPMGARILKSNILQPSNDAEKLRGRYDALEELASKEQMFHGVRDALKGFVDTDRVLSQLVLEPTKLDFHHAEQSINNVVQLKTFIDGITPIWQALTGATSEELVKIRSLCAGERFQNVKTLIEACFNDDVTYSTQPLELRNQRTYAIKAGFNGLLDIARQTYKEANEDAFSLVNELNDAHDFTLDLKYETARSYYICIPISSLDNPLPENFINVYRRRNHVECQTLNLLKINQRIIDAHNEVINMSDSTIQDLIASVRSHIAPLFKISESVGFLDMLGAFSFLVASSNGTYVKPELTPKTLAIKSGRHPLIERIQKTSRYIPNDVYATQTSRFQIITGCNMSGKSTYIRSIALSTIIAQIGCFVPATYASFPLVHQIFARCSTTSVESDNDVGANLSTFSTEMRDTAFILSNISPRSLVLVDELGRGTSTTDGLAIAIAISEALISSGAMVWFVTHFHPLPTILAERAGVVNLHLAVDISQDRMRMLYKIRDGASKNQFYGLALAKVLNFPPDVLEVAEHVSMSLHSKNETKSKDKRTVAIARRRKLLLSLKEQLSQAQQGKMKGKKLLQWLESLQNEFTIRMAGIEADAQAAESDEELEEIDDGDRAQEPTEPQVQRQVSPQFLGAQDIIHEERTAEVQAHGNTPNVSMQHSQAPTSSPRRSTSKIPDTPLKTRAPVQKLAYDNDPIQNAFLAMIADEERELTAHVEHEAQSPSWPETPRSAIRPYLSSNYFPCSHDNDAAAPDMKSSVYIKQEKF